MEKNASYSNGGSKGLQRATRGIYKVMEKKKDSIRVANLGDIRLSGQVPLRGV